LLHEEKARTSNATNGKYNFLIMVFKMLVCINI